MPRGIYALYTVNNYFQTFYVLKKLDKLPTPTCEISMVFGRTLTEYIQLLQ